MEQADVGLRYLHQRVAPSVDQQWVTVKFRYDNALSSRKVEVQFRP